MRRETARAAAFASDELVFHFCVFSNGYTPFRPVVPYSERVSRANGSGTMVRNCIVLERQCRGAHVVRFNILRYDRAVLWSCSNATFTALVRVSGKDCRGRWRMSPGANSLTAFWAHRSAVGIAEEGCTADVVPDVTGNPSTTESSVQSRAVPLCVIG